MSDEKWEQLTPEQQEAWLKESKAALLKQIEQQLPTIDKMADIASGASSEGAVVDALASALTDAIAKEMGL